MNQYTRTLDELERGIKDMLERGYTPENVRSHLKLIVDNILRIQEKEQ